MYADVILPLPLPGTFTYTVPEELLPAVKAGSRVIVQFGRKKYYTGIVQVVYPSDPPKPYEVKPLTQVLDPDPIVRRPQINLWEWIAEYYLCSIGDVYRAAVPTGLKIESETFIEAQSDFEEDASKRLTDRELMIYQTLIHKGTKMKVADIEKATGLKNVGVTASALLERGAVFISERLVEKYTSRKEVYVAVNPEYVAEGAVSAAFAMLKGAPKQERAYLALLEMSGAMRKGATPTEVTRKALMERSGVSAPIISQLQQKGLISIVKREINRFKPTDLCRGTLPTLSEAQQKALDSIHRSWIEKDVTLLHGVTSSGKTELYIHLMDYVLSKGKQALLLVPEIALTTQLTDRLYQVFGDKVVVYHSKFSDNERVDIWKSLLHSSEPKVIIGPRSAVFLPFSSLGLVIVDEEHESSYKQADPAPRYNGRDVAIVLAKMHGAKTLLGSATPSIETSYKAREGKYGHVTLSERYAGSVLPEVEIVDMTLARKKKELEGPFATRTAQCVRDAVADGKQAILFLNRRGFAPMVTCKQCAWVPKCNYCDVALTYHKRIDRLVCHYCGTPYPLPTICPACKQPEVEVIGYGTERIEQEVENTFPNIAVSRMDLDTTRNKDGYQNLINDFSNRKSQILVGTQMVTKGLDFEGVTMVGIINADAMLNQPDFRSAERTFNMIEQVAGRAGRRDTPGHVIIQTRQPEERIYKFAAAHDYESYYQSELSERHRYSYPPFTRIINIYLKHRDIEHVNDLGLLYGRRLRELFGNRVFGPEEPAVSRVQSLYIRKIMLKVELNASMKKVKEILRSVFEELHASSHPAAKGAVIYYDVDPV